jgi:dCMP deaminase
VAKSERQSWDQYFLSLANQVATRSTCDRAHVGCVLVKDRAILSTGYNGSLPGHAHCDDVGHMVVDNHCIRTVHAETNAVAQAAKNGVALEGCTAYVTHTPCLVCLKLLNSSGVKRLIIGSKYNPDENWHYFIGRMIVVTSG